MQDLLFKQSNFVVTNYIGTI